MTSRIKSFLSSLDDEALVGSYGQLVKELRGRGIVTNKNVTGELGEHMVIDRYSITPGLPKLRRAPAGTKNVDALSSRGDRYSIKTVTSKTTGSFYDLEPKGSTLPDTPVFEYLVVAVLDDYYKLIKLLEFEWNKFIKHKSWNSRMKNWNLILTQKVVADAKDVLGR